MKTLTETETIIIDSIGGKAEHAWWGECCGTLKAVHYKFPPCVVLKEENEAEDIDREKVL